MDKSLVSTSKFLSLVLRHQPDAIDLALDKNGWADLDELLEKAQASGRRISRDLVLRVVRDNDKKRFAISDDGTQIRANQGHSVEVDLELAPAEPPDELYHGTVERFLDSIRRSGLKSGSRQHVHLSPDRKTAKTVGQRRGTPVILSIRTGEMYRDGHLFYLSKNGVWLTDHVPAKYIELNSE